MTPHGRGTAAGEGDSAARREADEAFARWETAVEAVRAELTTPDGHWFLDALIWPVHEMRAQRVRHREGPMPPVDLMARAFERLGEDPPQRSLAEVMVVECELFTLSDWPQNGMEVLETAREGCLTRRPALRCPPAAGDDVHRHAREELERVATELAAYGVRLPVSRVLASVRWWPGREPVLPREPRTDPLGLETIGRVLRDSQHAGAPWHGPYRRAQAVSSGEGIARIDVVEWILAALRYRTEVLDELMHP